MKIRVATESDLAELAELYRYSVLAIAPQYYQAEQVQMWASFPSSPEWGRDFILKPVTFVAETNNQILGFSGLEPDGHVASLYVHGDHGRQGIGSSLLTAVLDFAHTQQITHLHTEASEVSKPLFEKFGFQVHETEQALRNGVQFQRYLMRKELSP